MLKGIFLCLLVLCACQQQNETQNIDTNPEGSGQKTNPKKQIPNSKTQSRRVGTKHKTDTVWLQQLEALDSAWNRRRSQHEFVCFLRQYEYQTGLETSDMPKIYREHDDLWQINAHAWDLLLRTEKYSLDCGLHALRFKALGQLYDIEMLEAHFSFLDDTSSKGHIASIVALSGKENTSFFFHDPMFNYHIEHADGGWPMNFVEQLRLLATGQAEKIEVAHKPSVSVYLNSKPDTPHHFNEATTMGSSNNPNLQFKFTGVKSVKKYLEDPRLRFDKMFSERGLQMTIDDVDDMKYLPLILKEVFGPPEHVQNLKQQIRQVVEETELVLPTDF